MNHNACWLGAGIQKLNIIFVRCPWKRRHCPWIFILFLYQILTSFCVILAGLLVNKYFDWQRPVYVLFIRPSLTLIRKHSKDILEISGAWINIFLVWKITNSIIKPCLAPIPFLIQISITNQFRTAKKLFTWIWLSHSLLLYFFAPMQINY